MHFSREFDIFIIFKIDNFDQKKFLNQPASKNGHTVPLNSLIFRGAYLFCLIVNSV